MIPTIFHFAVFQKLFSFFRGRKYSTHQIQLYTPGFEELNNVWGILGGRQLPSVIYRIQLIEIEQNKTLSSSEVITKVGGTLNHIKP